MRSPELGGAALIAANSRAESGCRIGIGQSGPLRAESANTTRAATGKGLGASPSARMRADKESDVNGASSEVRGISAR